MTFTNSYIDSDTWKKGTIHVHTDNSPCGHYPVREVCEKYFDRILKYDFLAITDHMLITDVDGCDFGKVVYRGEEFKRHLRQILGVGIQEIPDDPDDLTNHQIIIDEIHRQNGISVICHPHLYTDDYWPLEELLNLQGYDAIEIYNHNEKMNNAGRSIASDLWDKLLVAGRRVWGMANDDMHHYSRLAGGFMKVQVDETHSDILDNLKNGRFYSSNGLNALTYELGRESVYIKFDNSVHNILRCRFISDGQIKYEKEVLEEVEMPIWNGIDTYFRIEACSEDGSRIWFQPHWVEGGIL